MLYETNKNNTNNVGLCWIHIYKFCVKCCFTLTCEWHKSIINTTGWRGSNALLRLKIHAY